MKKLGILYENCVFYDATNGPLSTVILSAKTGSRTIVHANPGVPEVNSTHFSTLNLSHYSWLHFEGRNCLEVTKMLQFATELRKDQGMTYTISMEMEKHRDSIEQCLSFPDVLFVGKDWAKSKGLTNKLETLQFVTKLVAPNASVVVAWGEDGAAACGADRKIIQVPAIPPKVVKDTLGAGDTFCATVIHFLQRNESLAASVELGCKVASAKIAIDGFDGLEKLCLNL